MNPPEYKAAVISDIHANLTALEAVLEYIDTIGADEIICLGDVIGKGVFPSRTVDICRDRCSVVLMGNHEDFFLKKPKHVDHYEWVREQLSAEQIEWLAERPVRHDLYLSGRKIRLCHAGPTDVHFRVYPSESRKRKLELFEPVDPADRSPDVFGYGDVHWAYIEYFDQCKTLFNCGSVGNSMAMPLASFAVISGFPGSPAEISTPDAPEHIKSCAPFGIQFYRVPYDIEKELKATEASDMPLKGKDIYMREIRTGTWWKRWSRYT